MVLYQKGELMNKKYFKPEQIIMKLREAEVYLNKGMNASEACRKIGITENTYYRWRKKYGGMQINQAKEMKALEEENRRLKKLVADLSLDNQVLKEYQKVIKSGKY
jgi:transposase-like protein